MNSANIVLYITPRRSPQSPRSPRSPRSPYLAGGVEAEGDRDVLVLQVGVDRLRAPHHSRRALVRGEVLRQQARVRVAVVPADHHQTVQFQRRAVVARPLELLRRLDLVAAAADDVEAARVAVPGRRKKGEVPW